MAKSFIDVLFSTPTRLPPRPGIRRMADLCGRCGCLHISKAEADDCRHKNFCREQK